MVFEIVVVNDGEQAGDHTDNGDGVYHETDPAIVDPLLSDQIILQQRCFQIEDKREDRRNGNPALARREVEEEIPQCVARARRGK